MCYLNAMAATNAAAAASFLTSSAFLPPPPPSLARGRLPAITSPPAAHSQESTSAFMALRADRLRGGEEGSEGSGRRFPDLASSRSSEENLPY